MTDTRDYSSRQIYIRSHLYAIFEEMANESGSTVDYLINESMRYYAKYEHGISVVDPQSTGRSRNSPPPLPTLSKPSEFAGGRPLYLWFNQQRYVIDKPRFIVGRGGVNKQCDLVIPDSNISRNHCVVTYHNGDHLIRDLGSTNGVEYRGDKVSQKKISEGDQFYLCDYSITFSYIADQVYHA